MKHITLLSTQIKLCLFISTHKSLRSKATLSHRFKILRAIWHKTAISHKNFLIGTSFAFYQIAPPLGILNRSPGVQRSADLWGTFWLLFRTSEKVTEKTLFCLLLQRRKVTLKHPGGLLGVVLSKHAQICLKT